MYCQFSYEEEGFVSYKLRMEGLSRTFKVPKSYFELTISFNLTVCMYIGSFYINSDMKLMRTKSGNIWLLQKVVIYGFCDLEKWVNVICL